MRLGKNGERIAMLLALTMGRGVPGRSLRGGRLSLLSAEPTQLTGSTKHKFTEDVMSVRQKCTPASLLISRRQASALCWPHQPAAL